MKINQILIIIVTTLCTAVVAPVLVVSVSRAGARERSLGRLGGEYDNY